MKPVRRIAMLARIAFAARVARVALVALSCASAGAQQAKEPAAALSLRSLAATCAQCHGTDGHAPADSIVPGLAGLPAAEIVERMLQFKADTRASTLMPQIARGYSNGQIRALAAYFAAQARRTDNAMATGTALEIRTGCMTMETHASDAADVLNANGRIAMEARACSDATS